MGQLDKMANALFGGKRAETQDGFAQDKTATIIGTAVTDSDSGAVMVELSSDVTNPEPVEIDGETYFEDASTAVELPTTQAVQAGDEVLVSVYGGTALKNSVVTGVVGSGDRVAADAEAAREIAEATGQHFWDADDGAHVTEVTREEWEDSTSPNYHSGPNSLWNSLGMLFRDGLNNLLAIVTGASPGLQIFDGQGNTDENIVASFTSAGQRVGNLNDFHSMVDEKSFGLYLAADRLINFSSDGLLTSVYLGGSTAAPGKEYTDAQVQALLSALQDGCYIVDQTKVYDKNDKDTGFRLKLPYDSLGCAQIRDRYATIIISANFELLYSNGSTYAHGFRIEPVLSPATEVPGAPVEIAMGGTTTNAQNGSLSVNARENITLLANASSNRVAYTSVSLSNTSGGTSSVGIRAKQLSLYDSATAAADQFAISDVIAALEKAIRLGTTYSASTNVSITANTDIMGASVNVPAGTYLVICWQTFLNPGSSGQRTTTIGTYSGGSLASYTTAVQATRDQVRVQHMNIVTTTGSSTTLQAYARSNIAASGNNNSQINAVCIG